MVKVLIDGKEYEGNEISVINIENCKIIENKLAYGFVEKSVQEFVSVPKEIQFYQEYYENDSEQDREIKNGAVGLFINNHMLVSTSSSIKDNVNWGFIPTWLVRGVVRIENIDWHPVDCVLVPVKRSELKAGDWAVHFYRNIADENLKEISNYRLVIGENKIVKMLNNSKINIVEESYGSNYGNWFKVVPRSDLK